MRFGPSENESTERSPTPSSADTPTPNLTRRPHETPSFPTFDSTDTGGGYPHSPLLFPAQFSPLARGQGPIVRLDPPRALHGFFGSHPRSSPTPSNADTPTPTFDSADTGGGYPHSPLLFPAQFSPLAWGQGPLVRLDPPRALHGFFGSHPRSSPTPSNADTPTPTFDSADTGGGFPHSPLLSPAQFSPLARGQGPVVRLDPPRALHGFFGSHPRSSPTPSNADTPTPNHTRRPHETPSFPTFDSDDTGGGYPHSPLLFPAQFSPLAWGQGPLVRLDPPRALHGFFGSHPRSSPTYSTAPRPRPRPTRPRRGLPNVPNY